MNRDDELFQRGREEAAKAIELVATLALGGSRNPWKRKQWREAFRAAAAAIARAQTYIPSDAPAGEIETTDGTLHREPPA